jgi:lipopolysaccharide export system ATP-binding protein
MKHYPSQIEHIILIDGKIFCSGSAEDIAQNEEVRKRYLGETFSLERYE